MSFVFAPALATLSVVAVPRTVAVAAGLRKLAEPMAMTLNV